LFKQFSYYQHIYSCIIININTGGVFKIENLEQFLQHYGYIAVFIGTFIEGEIFLLIVGIFIKVGLLSPIPALISAILGAFTHELIYFFFGRWKGREFLLKNSYTRKKYRKAKQLVEKYGDISIFIIRFLYGMRVIPMVFLGATRFNPVRFAVIDLISLLIWSFIYIHITFVIFF